MTNKTEAQIIGEIVVRLLGKYSHLPESTVTSVITDIWDSFADSKVREYLPLLTERRAVGELGRMPMELRAAG